MITNQANIEQRGNGVKVIISTIGRRGPQGPPGEATRFFDSVQDAVNADPVVRDDEIFETPEGIWRRDSSLSSGAEFIRAFPATEQQIADIGQSVYDLHNQVDVELAGIRSDNAAFQSNVNQDLQQITAEKQVFEGEVQDIKDALANMTTTGKIYDSLAEAIAESPKPADGTPFSVMRDGDNDGYYKFDSTQPDGVKFGRKFDRRIQVESISQLKNYKGRPGEAVDVLGYYESGDGGGGTFYWDSASTEEDNGGTIIESSGEVNGRWKRRVDGSVNVSWFGAIGGQDVFTEELNAAINYTSEIGGVLDLDSRGISFTGRVIIPSGVEIRNGTLRSVETYRDPNAPLANSSVFHLGGENIRVENITFDFNEVNNYGIQVLGVSKNIRIVNCKLRNLKEIDGVTGISTCGIRIDDGAEDIKIQGGSIENVIPFENGVSGDTQGAGRGILIGEVINVEVRDVLFKNIQGWEDGDCIHVATNLNGTKWSRTDVTIQNCKLPNIFKSGIKLQASGVKLLWNEITSNQPLGSTNYPVAGIRDYGDSNTIMFNTVRMIEANACIVVGAQGEVSESFTSNNFLHINESGESEIHKICHIKISQPISNSSYDSNEMHGYGGIDFTVALRIDNCTFDYNKFYNGRFRGTYESGNDFIRDTSISYNIFKHSDPSQPNYDIWLKNPDGVVCKFNTSFGSKRNYVVIGDVGPNKVKLVEHSNIGFIGSDKINTVNVDSGEDNIIYTEDVDTSEAEEINYVSIQNDVGGKVESVPNLNLDEIDTTCILFSGSFAGTTPAGVNRGYIATYTYSGTNVQFIIQYDTNGLWMRRKAGGSFSQWLKLNTSGASGSYTSQDGKTVTVENGIITSITEPIPEE